MTDPVSFRFNTDHFTNLTAHSSMEEDSIDRISTIARNHSPLGFSSDEDSDATVQLSSTVGAKRKNSFYIEDEEDSDEDVSIKRLCQTLNQSSILEQRTPQQQILSAIQQRNFQQLPQLIKDLSQEEQVVWINRAIQNSRRTEIPIFVEMGVNLTDENDRKTILSVIYPKYPIFVMHMFPKFNIQDPLFLLNFAKMVIQTISHENYTNLSTLARFIEHFKIEDTTLLQELALAIQGRYTSFSSLLHLTTGSPFHHLILPPLKNFKLTEEFYIQLAKETMNQYFTQALIEIKSNPEFSGNRFNGYQWPFKNYEKAFKDCYGIREKGFLQQSFESFGEDLKTLIDSNMEF